MTLRYRLFACTLLSLFLVSASGTLRAQKEAPDQGRTVHNMRVQPFFFDAFNFAEYDDFGLKGRVDVFVHVPNDIVTFVKNNEFYVGGYTVTVLVTDPENSRLIKEETWERKLELLSFERTKNPAYYDLTQRSLVLEPGTVNLEVRFEDKESQKEFRLSRSFTVRGYDGNLPGMSDIMLVRDAQLVQGRRQISPQINPNVAMLENGFDVFYEVYNPYQLAGVQIDYVITRRGGKEVFTKEDVQPLKRGVNTFLGKINSTGLGIGAYTLTTSVRQVNDSSAAGLLASAERQFMIEWLTAGAPISLGDLDEAIDQLRYFAKSEDIEYIRAAEDTQERRKRFEAFWEKHNPASGSGNNSAMIEYYNRVAYANQQFGHYIAGWKTDRGMTYIVYGAPDYIDRHPVDVESKPYEVWEYYDINRRFVFIDESGFGDYRLLYPLWDDRNRLR
ncbi:MAG TPA: GWxTD domain-containing protein [Bacteroidota bacterium]|nr:GWxTD domain-containing protein [Bacteroidota bacterium]